MPVMIARLPSTSQRPSSVNILLEAQYTLQKWNALFYSHIKTYAVIFRNLSLNTTSQICLETIHFVCPKETWNNPEINRKNHSPIAFVNFSSWSYMKALVSVSSAVSFVDM